MTRPDLGSSRRHHIADILRAYADGHLHLEDAVDGIELDVFDAAPPPTPLSPEASLVVSAVAVLLVGLDRRAPGDAVQAGCALAIALTDEGILSALEVPR